MAYAEFIKQLNEQVWFKEFIENEMIPNIPSIPPHNPANDNTEAWKNASAMREGYRLCLYKLGVRLK